MIGNIKTNLKHHREAKNKKCIIVLVRYKKSRQIVKENIIKGE